MNNAFLYITCVLIWGSTWFAIVFQLGVVPAEVSIFYRYVLAALLLFSWCIIKRLPLRYPLSSHVYFALLGLCLFCINYIFAYHGQRYINSALMAIVFSTMLWMNIVNSRLFFGVRADNKVIIGAILGVIGVIVMFWPTVNSVSLEDKTVIGALLGTAGTLAASLGNMVSLKSQKMGLPIVQSNAWGMFYGALFTGAIAILSGRVFTFEFTQSYILSLAYLAIFGSVIGFGAYLTLLGRIGAHKAGYATILFPLVALVLSLLFEEFKLTPAILAGMVLVLLGNYFVMKRET